MPPLSAQERASFDHVINVVMGVGSTSQLIDALNRNGYNDICDIAAMSTTDVESLQYDVMDPDTNDVTTHWLKDAPTSYLVGTLRCFVHYVIFKDIQGFPISGNWQAITRTDFDDFRTGGEYQRMLTGSSNLQPPGTTSPATAKARDVVAEFRKGIKRDPTLFPILKDQKQWDNFERDTRVQARAQAVDNVLDPTYVASTSEERELFKEQQKYMCAVFVKALLTDQGKAIVRKYEKKSDAQSIYREITEYTSKSTQAGLEASALLAYVTTAILGEDTWKGTTASFILHWQDKLRLYEALVPAKDHFSGEVKQTLLQNAVGTVSLTLLSASTVPTKCCRHRGGTQ